MAIDTPVVAPDAGTPAPAQPAPPVTNGNIPAPAVPEAPPQQPPVTPEQPYALDEHISSLDSEQQATETPGEQPELSPEEAAQQEVQSQEPTLASVSARVTEMQGTVDKQNQELNYYRQQESVRTQQAAQSQFNAQRDREEAQAAQWYDQTQAQIAKMEDPDQRNVFQQAFNMRAEAMKMHIDASHQKRLNDARQKQLVHAGAENNRLNLIRYSSTQHQVPQATLVEILPRTDNIANPYEPVAKAYRKGVQDATRRLSADQRAEQQTDRIPAVGGVGGRAFTSIADAEQAHISGEITNNQMREQRLRFGEDVPY